MSNAPPPAGPLFSVTLGALRQVSAYDPSIQSFANEGSFARSANTPFYLFGGNNYKVGVDGGNGDRWTCRTREPAPERGIRPSARSRRTRASMAPTPTPLRQGGRTRDYLSVIGHTSSGQLCIGMSSAPSSTLPTWTDPVVCINNTGEANDFPSIAWDPGGHTLYATGRGSGMWIYQKYACNSTVGGSLCTVPFDTIVNPTMVSESGSDSDITVNPCTGSPIVSSRDGSNLNLVFAHGDGTAGVCQVSSTEPSAGNDNCPVTGDPLHPLNCDSHEVCPCSGQNKTDCGRSAATGGGSTCPHAAHRISIKAVALPGQPTKCSLFAAWTKSFKNSNNNTRYEARYAQIDVTVDELSCLAPFSHLEDLTFTATATDGNLYDANVSVDELAGNVGVFFYADNDAGHCGTLYKGLVSTGLSMANRQLVTLSDASFPQVIFAMAGGGDWVAAIKDGIPGAGFYPTWAVPKQNANGIACNGNTYNETVHGRLITIQ